MLVFHPGKSLFPQPARDQHQRSVNPLQPAVPTPPIEAQHKKTWSLIGSETRGDDSGVIRAQTDPAKRTPQGKSLVCSGMNNPGEITAAQQQHFTPDLPGGSDSFQNSPECFLSIPTEKVILQLPLTLLSSSPPFKKNGDLEVTRAILNTTATLARNGPDIVTMPLSMSVDPRSHILQLDTGPRTDQSPQLHPSSSTRS